jgi:hypothetical protein
MPPPALFELLKEHALKHPIIGDDELRQLVRQGVLLPRDPFDHQDHSTL